MDSNMRDMLDEVAQDGKEFIESSDIEQISDDDLGSFSVLGSSKSSMSACCLNDKDLFSDLSWPAPTNDYDSLPVEVAPCTRVHSYTHTPNRKVNMMLNFFMAVSMAMVVGLGIGHFLGYSEITEKQPFTMFKQDIENNISSCNDSTNGNINEPDIFVEKLEQWKGVFFKIFAENEILQRALDQANIQIENYNQQGSHYKATDVHISQYRNLRLQLIRQQLENLAILKKMDLLNKTELDKLQYSYYQYTGIETDDGGPKTRANTLGREIIEAVKHGIIITENIDNSELKRTTRKLKNKIDIGGVNASMDLLPERKITHGLKSEEFDLKSAKNIMGHPAPQLELPDDKKKEEISHNHQRSAVFEADSGKLNGIMAEAVQKILDKIESLPQRKEMFDLNLSQFYDLWVGIQNRLLADMRNETLLIETQKFTQNIVKTVLMSIGNLFNGYHASPSTVESNEDGIILNQIMNLLRNVDGQLSGVASKLSHLEKDNFGNDHHRDPGKVPLAATSEDVVKAEVKSSKTEAKSEPILPSTDKKNKRYDKMTKQKGKIIDVKKENNNKDDDGGAWVFERAQSRDKKRRDHQKAHRVSISDRKRYRKKFNADDDDYDEYRESKKEKKRSQKKEVKYDHKYKKHSTNDFQRRSKYRSDSDNHAKLHQSRNYEEFHHDESYFSN